MMYLYPWLWFYIWYHLFTSTIEVVRSETPVIIRKPVIWYLPVTTGLWTPPNKILRLSHGVFYHWYCGLSVQSVVGIGTACMYTCICVRKYCGLYQIFTFTFILIVNWEVHKFCSELTKCSAFQMLGQYVIPHPLHSAVLYFQVTLCHSVRQQ